MAEKSDSPTIPSPQPHITSGQKHLLPAVDPTLEPPTLLIASPTVVVPPTAPSLPLPSTDALIGKILNGKYQIRREIGSGGMGRVYEACHLGLEKTVALKVIRTNFLGDAETVERFRREARTCASIEHPNSVQVFDYGVDDQQYYLVMEYLRGESLRERLRRQIRLSLADVVSLAEQLCLVLDAMHRRGIIHRDLKPDNIFFNQVEDREIIKVLDFGIAKLIDEAQSGQEVTATNAILGTPRYMSPEQCQGHPVDRFSDIYSLGIIFYEVLTGKPPFESDSLYSLALKHLTVRPTPPHELSPDLPLPVSQIVVNMLAKDKDQRPASAREVYHALYAATQTGNLPSPPLQPEPLKAVSHTQKTKAAPTQIAGVEQQLEHLESLIGDLSHMASEPACHPDQVLIRLAEFITSGTRVLTHLETPVSGAHSTESHQATLLTLQFLAQELEQRLEDLKTKGGLATSLEGYRLRLHQGIVIPASRQLMLLRSKTPHSTEEEAFITFEDVEPEVSLDGSDQLIEELKSDNDLRRHEAVLSIVGSGMELFFMALQTHTETERDDLLERLWHKADVILLEGRGRARMVFNMAMMFVSCPQQAEKWKTLLDLFDQNITHQVTPETLRSGIALSPASDRRVFARALLFHPSLVLRRLALSWLGPADFWGVITCLSTPVSWLLEIWTFLKPQVSPDYLKVFFLCVRDTLLRQGPVERTHSVMELVKEFFKCDFFHEDTFFNLLVELDQHIRSEAARHQLLVDIDSEYLTLLKRFVSANAYADQPPLEMASIPLPVQRKLARNGYFLKFFVCHPIDRIALECFPHLVKLENIAPYLSMFAINTQLLLTLGKEKHLFQREDCRYALVANPKTPAHIVFNHLRMLRKDNLRKLAECRECNQVSRNHAAKMLNLKV